MFRSTGIEWPPVTVRHAVLVTLLAMASACGEREAPPPEAGAPAAGAPAAAPESSGPLTVADVGLSTPESVLHDPDADVYLVSNINGTPLDRDDNGFISRVRPDGSVEDLRWIDGAAAEFTLNAPKGMALKGDTLFVSDIDSVRAFDRTTGAALGARGVAGASFLNDLTTGPDGTLYVTDTGFDAQFQPTGSAALYRWGAEGWTQVASGDALMGPNGIVADADGVLLVGFAGNTVLRIPAGGGEPTTVATLPGGQLDGLVRLADGTLLVSSWESSSVYRVDPSGAVTAVAEGVEAPADIGWDERRRRVLIPLFNANRIEARPIG